MICCIEQKEVAEKKQKTQLENAKNQKVRK